MDDVLSKAAALVSWLTLQRLTAELIRKGLLDADETVELVDQVVLSMERHGTHPDASPELDKVSRFLPRDFQSLLETIRRSRRTSPRHE